MTSTTRRSNVMTIKDTAFYAGLFLGSILLISTTYVFVKRQTFGLGGVFLIIFGSFLVGLSIWTSFEFSINKDGSITAKYTQEIKEDLGEKTADINGNIEFLKIKIAELSQDVTALKAANPNAKLSKDVLDRREAKEQEFKKNTDYSVLVFYKSTQKEKARKVTEKLLSVGFRSSATESDLKEVRRQFDQNTAWIVYTKRGKDKLATLRNVLQDLINDKQIIYRDTEYSLRRGDIQILLY
jgi:hypothetical protein